MAAEWVKWDKGTQEYHGGQEWQSIQNFKEDFSVTTNGLGTPDSGLAAATAALSTIGHYPPADFEPAITSLAKFLWPDTDGASGRPRLLLGNGASELIDLVARVGCEAAGGGWKPSHLSAQYREYERSSKAAGHPTKAPGDKTAALTCLVNPCNPTGDYLTVDRVKAYIEEHCGDHSSVMVDESMQMWHGPEWRQDSLVSQSTWIGELAARRGIQVFIVHSWTKIWSCTGIRLGSVIAPTVDMCQRIKKHQVPWSVNCCGLAFLDAVVKDSAYLEKTWEVTPTWRKRTVEWFTAHRPTWVVHGAPFLSWLWVDTKDSDAAAAVIERCKAAGVPVRAGAHGYNHPTFVRIAVRSPELQDALFAAISDS